LHALDLTDGVTVWEARDGHDLAVSALAVGVLDGNPVVASGGDDGVVRLRNLRDGTLQLSTHPGHAGRVLAMAVSATPVLGDLFSLGTDGRIRTWRIRTWNATSEQLSVVRVADDGVVVAATFGSGFVGPFAVYFNEDEHERIALWGIRTADEERSIHVGGAPRAMTVIRLGQLQTVVSGGRDGLVRLVDLGTGNPIMPPLVGHIGPVEAVSSASFDSEPVVVSGGADGTVRVWEDLAARSASGEASVEQISVASEVMTTRVEGEAAVASIGVGGSLHVTMARSGRVVVRHPVRIAGIAALAAAEMDGRDVVVTGSLDGVMRVWDPATGTQLLSPRSSRQTRLTAVATGVRQDQQVIVVTGSGGIEVWELRGGPVGMACTPPDWFSSALTVVSLTKQPLIVAGGEDGNVLLLDLTTGTRQGRLAGHRGAVRGLAAGLLDGTPVAVSAGRDGALLMWDLAAKVPFPAPFAFVDQTDATSVCLMPAGSGKTVVVSGHDDGSVRWWSPSGEQLGVVDVGGAVRGVTSVGERSIIVATEMGILPLDLADPSDPADSS
jgi:hypothetical protein